MLDKIKTKVRAIKEKYPDFFLYTSGVLLLIIIIIIL